MMIYIDPVVAMLHNQKTGRWHPILFVGAPLPGGGGPMRHRSKGHHTDGFDTREEADKTARKMSEKVSGLRFLLDLPLAWDGLDIPSMTAFFPDRDADNQGTAIKNATHAG
jgi:hypothetical protein